MPRRIIIHSGFHKTATTTLQSTLRENRTALKSHLALRLRWHLKDIVAAARGYSTFLDPLTLVKVETRFARMINDLPDMPRRTLIISAEELNGHMPGRGDLATYEAAPVLLYSYWEIARARYPEAEIMIYLSTRGRDKWMESAYWEHVKSSSMTMSLDEFQSRYPKAGQLDDMVSEIASRVPVPVHATALEACRDLPLGPADPLLDLCSIPAKLRHGLKPIEPENQRLGIQVLEAMRDINQNISDPSARKAAKLALMAEATNT